MKNRPITDYVVVVVVVAALAVAVGIDVVHKTMYGIEMSTVWPWINWMNGAGLPSTIRLDRN